MNNQLFNQLQSNIAILRQKVASNFLVQQNQIQSITNQSIILKTIDCGEFSISHTALSHTILEGTDPSDLSSSTIGPTLVVDKIIAEKFKTENNKTVLKRVRIYTNIPCRIVGPLKFAQGFELKMRKAYATGMINGDGIATGVFSGYYNGIISQHSNGIINVNPGGENSNEYVKYNTMQFNIDCSSSTHDIGINSDKINTYYAFTFKIFDIVPTGTYKIKVLLDVEETI